MSAVAEGAVVADCLLPAQYTTPRRTAHLPPVRVGPRRGSLVRAGPGVAGAGILRAAVWQDPVIGSNEPVSGKELRRGLQRLHPAPGAPNFPPHCGNSARP